MPSGKGSEAEADTNRCPSKQALEHSSRLNRLHPSCADHFLCDAEYKLSLHS